MEVIENIRCPLAICSCGRWILVAEGCQGQIHKDRVNGQIKVWLADCYECFLKKIGKEPQIFSLL